MRLLRSGLLAVLAVAAGAPGAGAQVTTTQGAPPQGETGPGLQFNGLGRTYIQQADLGGRLAETDTLTATSLADGEFVLDLAVNAQPNRVTEVQGVLRLRNELGGFFGAGVVVEVRELWARGIIADALEYRLGDMDVALTPYTLFLPDADGRVNLPEVFAPQLDRVAYEQFDTGRNERRLQGGRLDFGLGFDRGLDAVDVRAFLARIRPTDFQTRPTRLLGGGRVGATSLPVGPTNARAQAGVNLTSTWDDLDSGNANAGIRNAVVSLDATLTAVDRPAFSVALRGEGGRSVVQNAVGGADPQTLDRETDTFVEAGVEAVLKRARVTLSATAVRVGPDVFSAAAQSRRVDPSRSPSLFTRVGNDRDLRPATLFDRTRDPALYTFRVEDQLMAYDPRYNNAQPYGQATPNRRGLRLGAAYRPGADAVRGEVQVALLREVRGQGTDELKDFALVRARADAPLARLVGYRRALTVTLGTQLEQTRRGGEALEAIDLTSAFVEAGVTAEVYDRLDVLLGLVGRTSSGREYVPRYERFNDVRDFDPFVTDDGELLLGSGLRYRFTDDVYLTVQAQSFRYRSDAAPERGYRLNQVFALYSMTF